MLRKIGLFTAFSLVFVFGSVSARADASIGISLWDKPQMDMGSGLGHGMGGNMKLANMGISLDTQQVASGPVTFNVLNTSADFVHEMVVAPLKSPDEMLPYDEGNAKVDENAAGHVGEVAELDPGKSRSVTLDLSPGAYILYCDIPGHYMAGMWTILNVK